MHSKCIQRKRKQEKESFPLHPLIKKKNIKKKKIFSVVGLVTRARARLCRSYHSVQVIAVIALDVLFMYCEPSARSLPKTIKNIKFDKFLAK